MKVFITRKLPGNAVEMLAGKGFEIDQYKGKKISRRELIKRASGADALICLLTENIDREVIDSLKKCRIIANVAVGYNNIDVDYAAEKNIIVTNTPDILTEATAELAFTLILSAARRVLEGDAMMRSRSFKGWDPSLLLGIELNDKVLGIVGAGRIGGEVARKGLAFGMELVYTDPKAKSVMEMGYGAKKVSLDRLLKISDVISLHVPLCKETFHLLNGKNMQLMKKSAILINTSRGEIIEEEALIKILKEKRIFAAGLDVFENEPDINEKFLKLKNVVLLPHIGSATLETRSKMALLAAENVLAVLKGKSPKTPVNRIF